MILKYENGAESAKKIQGIVPLPIRVPSMTVKGSKVILNIIECDVLYDDLIEDYTSYGTMFERLFKGINHDSLEIRYQSAIDQSLQEPQANEVYLITGSKFGAYEDEMWITELITWVQQAYKVGSRLIGVCFGHQIIAQALGGQVVNSDKGWGVGIRSLEVKDTPDLDLQTRLPSSLRLIYSHQDQVIQLPAGAHTLLSDDFCPYGGFYIDKQIITFQGHPEFDAEYTQRLLGRRAENIGVERFEAAMAAINGETDNITVGKYLLEWMQLV